MRRIPEHEFTAEQKQIVDAAFEGKHPAKNPTFCLIGGVTGNGKNRIGRKLMSGNPQGWLGGMHLDPETTIIIRTSMFRNLESFKMHSDVIHPEKLPDNLDEYYSICRAICERAKQGGYSVLFLDHAEHMKYTRPIVETFQGWDSYLMVPQLRDYEYHDVAGKREENGIKPDHYRALFQIDAINKLWPEYEKLFTYTEMYGYPEPHPPEVLACRSDHGKREVIDMELLKQISPEVARASSNSTSSANTMTPA